MSDEAERAVAAIDAETAVRWIRLSQELQQLMAWINENVAKANEMAAELQIDTRLTLLETDQTSVFFRLPSMKGPADA